MSLRKHELDLVDRVEEKEDNLEELLVELDDIENEALSVDQDSDEYGELEEEWDDVKGEVIETRGEILKFKEAVVSYSGGFDLNKLGEGLNDEEYREVINEKYAEIDSCMFRVQELTYGQLQSVSDMMMEESFEVDMERQSVEGTPQSGFYQIELLKAAIIDWPEHAPVLSKRGERDQPMPGDYPIPVSEWMYDRVDAYNTTGEANMGNSSLGEALKSKR